MKVGRTACRSTHTAATSSPSAATAEPEMTSPRTWRRARRRPVRRRHVTPSGAWPRRGCRRCRPLLRRHRRHRRLGAPAVTSYTQLCHVM